MLEAILTSQTRSASFPAAGFAEWGGPGWAISFIEDVKVIEHGGSIHGFQVKLKVVPERRFAIAILTNSGRDGVVGDRVAGWALDHILGLRAHGPQAISLSERVLVRVAGSYRSMGVEDVTFTVQNGGLRRVIKEIDPITNREQALPSHLLRPICEREFVVVTQDENEGS